MFFFKPLQHNYSAHTTSFRGEQSLSSHCVLYNQTTHCIFVSNNYTQRLGLSHIRFSIDHTTAYQSCHYLSRCTLGMSGKTLSNGTLSLRFMQNAQRAKLQARADAEQAKTRDETEWEVSKEIKEAWGIDAASQSENLVTHEASYLPFLFSSSYPEISTSSTGPDRPSVLRGRRTFNERGQETIPQVRFALTPTSQNRHFRVQKRNLDDQNDESEAESPDESGSKNPQNSPKRPVSISGFRAPIATTRKSGKKARTKTAEMLVRESTALSPASLCPPSQNHAPPNDTGYMKPAGIDEPAEQAGRRNTVHKRNRDRDLDPEILELQGQKRKKKAQ
ncbi:hypothetical protein AcV7_010303 [Taiwanofungus camphoratus]|nr:hypothetical protein AcV7_010303 [Antrodia cinnamomea]